MVTYVSLINRAVEGTLPLRMNGVVAERRKPGFVVRMRHVRMQRVPCRWNASSIRRCSESVWCVTAIGRTSTTLVICAASGLYKYPQTRQQTCCLVHSR